MLQQSVVYAKNVGKNNEKNKSYINILSLSFNDDRMYNE